MYVFTKGGHKEITLTPYMQAWHTRIVTSLLHSACGDLILDKHGNLCSRDTWFGDQELSWEYHRCGDLLAMITANGWILTKHGAQYILENCSYALQDRRRLETVIKAEENE